MAQAAVAAWPRVVMVPGQAHAKVRSEVLTETRRDRAKMLPFDFELPFLSSFRLFPELAASLSRINSTKRMT